MFENAIHNVTGPAPFNAKKFPILIGLGDKFEKTQVCMTPDNVPRGVDFKILGTCVAVLQENKDATPC